MAERIPFLTAPFLFAAALVLFAEPAAAQSCAVLPPGVPPEGAPASDQVREEGTELTAQMLRDRGLVVLSAEEAQRRMVGEPFAECHELDCGADVVRSLGVDFAALVTIWAPRGAPSVVVVTLIGAEDSVAADAPVEGGALAPAIQSALSSALERWQAQQMGFLEVTSHPAGADVEIDGRVVGQTPLRHMTEAGQRRVRVHLEGYAPMEREVRVLATQEHPIEVTLTEVGVGAEEPVAPATRTEAHWANWLIGAGLTAGGVGALVSPIHTLARLGECTEEAMPGYCRRGIQFGAQSGVLTGVGLAALIGAVIVMAAQPIEVTTTVTPDSATLGVRGAF